MLPRGPDAPEQLGPLQGNMSEETPGLPASRFPETRAQDELFAILYAELRRLADRELRRYPAASVSATTLVHEAYINLAPREGLNFSDPRKFLRYAARAIRGLLIDFARRQQALKRGAGFHITQLSTRLGEGVVDGEELVRLSDALDELAMLDASLAELVDLKYFCGFSVADIAEMRGTSARTVQRDWEKARLILFRQLDAHEPEV